jgi:hypothetical protein
MRKAGIYFLLSYLRKIRNMEYFQEFLVNVIALLKYNYLSELLKIP